MAEVPVRVIVRVSMPYMYSFHIFFFYTDCSAVCTLIIIRLWALIRNLWPQSMLHSLTGQTLTREERAWSNSHQAFICILSSRAPNEVGVSIIWDVFWWYYALLSKQHARKGNYAPPFITNPINMPKNSWHVRNEMMIGI